MPTQTLHLDDVDDGVAAFDRNDPWTWIDDADLRDRLRHRHELAFALAVPA